MGRTEAYDSPARGRTKRRAGLRPRLRVDALVLLTGLLVLLPAGFFLWRVLDLIGELADGHGVAAGMVLVLMATAGATGRLYVSTVWAQSGRSPAEARRIRATGTAGRLDVFDPTLTLDATYGEVDHRMSEAEQSLPELVALVRSVAEALEVDAPTVLLIRGGSGAWLSDDGTMLTISTDALLVLSADELAADVALHLAPRRFPRVERQLRRARWVSTAANPGGPVFGGVFELPWRPAMFVGARLERAGAALAQTLADEAAELVAAHFGSQAAARAQAHRAVAPQLWREHLGAAQRAWTQTGAPLAPHAGWSAAWDAAVGREIVTQRGDLPGPTDRLGWSLEHADETVPARGWPCALEALAGDRGPQLLQWLDDGAEAQFRDAGMVALFGVAAAPETAAPQGPTAPGVVDELAPSGPATVAGPTDPGHAALPVELPQGTVLERLWPELELLDHARMRRDAGALALARALDRPGALPVLRSHAATVRWLSGDPSGVAAIDACLRDEPRTAIVLEPMASALHAAGAHELAGRIERGFAEFIEGPTAAEIDLSKLFGRGRKLEAVEWSPAVRDAVTELVAGHEPVKEAWLVVARGSEPSPMDPPVLALRTRMFGSAAVHGPDGLASALGAIVPGAVVRTWDEIDGRRRTALRRRLGAARIKG